MTVYTIFKIVDGEFFPTKMTSTTEVLRTEGYGAEKENDIIDINVQRVQQNAHEAYEYKMIFFFFT